MNGRFYGPPVYDLGVFPARFVVLGALVLGLSAVVPAGPAAGDDLGDQIDDVRARAQELTQDLADAESRLGELEQQISTVSTQADNARRSMAGLQSDVDDLVV